MQSMRCTSMAHSRPMNDVSRQSIGNKYPKRSHRVQGELRHVKESDDSSNLHKKPRSAPPQKNNQCRDDKASRPRPDTQANGQMRKKKDNFAAKNAGGAPKYDMLIVVEGVNDMKAVRRAVPNADVYVLGTATRAGDKEVHEQLRHLSDRYKGILLLLDPDVAGRQARNTLNVALGGCFHAFIPCMAATASADIRMKQAGDIGVEHADPISIRHALNRMRRSVLSRSLFTRDSLQNQGLIAHEMGQRGGDVTERRRLVSEFLGLGNCDGKQLLRQLNHYGFRKEDLEASLHWAEEKLQQKE